MTKSLALPLTLLALGLIVLAGVLFTNEQDAIGAGWTPVAQQFATTTVVGPRGTGAVREVVFAENAACKSRVITVPGNASSGGIMLSFDDISTGNVGSTTVGASVGHFQAASTTKEYDSAIYGCGVWNGWAWASTTITVSEF